MKTLTCELELATETKNMYRYEAADDAAPLGGLLVMKGAVDGDVPRTITVTVTL